MFCQTLKKTFFLLVRWKGARKFRIQKKELVEAQMVYTRKKYSNLDAIAHSGSRIRSIEPPRNKNKNKCSTYTCYLHLGSTEKMKKVNDVERIAYKQLASDF